MDEQDYKAMLMDAERRYVDTLRLLKNQESENEQLRNRIANLEAQLTQLMQDRRPEKSRFPYWESYYAEKDKK